MMMVEGKKSVGVVVSQRREIRRRGDERFSS